MAISISNSLPVTKTARPHSQQVAALVGSGSAADRQQMGNRASPFLYIALLPRLSGIFGVSVDELMGLKPLPDAAYIPTDKGKKKAI